MPLYEWECETCGKILEKYMPLEYSSCSTMNGCCGVIWRIVSKPASVRPAWDEYIDENLGDEPVLISGRRQRKEIMRIEGLEEKEMSSQKKREIRQKHEHIQRTRRVQNVDKGGLSGRC